MNDFGNSKCIQRTRELLDHMIQCYETKQYEEALQICSYFKARNPKYEQCLIVEKSIYERFQNYERALTAMNEWFHLTPDFDTGLTKLHLIHRIKKEELYIDFLKEVNSLPPFPNKDLLITLIQLYIPDYSEDAWNSIQMNKSISAIARQNMFLSHLETVYPHKNSKESTPIQFRKFCEYYTPMIRNKKIPDVTLGCSNEAVLIEFRQLPHLEFLIRNAIHKLRTEWSFTIVCGTNNIEWMTSLRDSIHQNIRIILLPFDNITPEQYSLLLSNRLFWESLHGEHILIYQEDTCIFGDAKDIQPFLEWDYIGAPWPIWLVTNEQGVGNGGFSLRSKRSMLRVIDKVDIFSTHYANPYNVGQIPPEDVYFANNIIEFNLGRVADRETGNHFSAENNINPLAFGGHGFYIYNPEWMSIMYERVIRDYTEELLS